MCRTLRTGRRRRAGYGSALAGYVAVGEEFASLGVVELFGSLLDKFAFLVEVAEELRCRVVMYVGSCAGIDVE